MLKIRDTRDHGEMRLADLDNGELFYIEDELGNDCLCRKVEPCCGMDIVLDGIPVMFMETGDLMLMDEKAWTDPVPDAKVIFEIVD